MDTRLLGPPMSIRNNYSEHDTDQRPEIAECDPEDTAAAQDFTVQENPFAFTPGQLNKLLNPKSLSAYSWPLQPGFTMEKCIMNFLKVNKVKRGLASMVNGAKLSVIADTGASHNVLSAAYANTRGLKIDSTTTEEFKVGNSRIINSIGTAKINYAFAGEPSKVFDLTCHVLKDCMYDLILGSTFLTATETLSKYRHRITDCVFKVMKFAHMAYAGSGSQLLQGTLDGSYPAFALPDTGAERNVMDLRYAEQLGLTIRTGSKNRGYLRFADDSVGETVGQVHTSWRFQSDEKEVPITFDVLENCCFDLIIGEQVLWEHNVFNRHLSSIISSSAEELDSYRLAPFAYEKFQWKMSSISDEDIFPPPNGTNNSARSLWRSLGVFAKSPRSARINNHPREAEEQRRREWDHRYGFDGARADANERATEKERRRRFKETYQRQGAPSSLLPSIPTAPERPPSRIRRDDPSSANPPAPAPDRARAPDAWTLSTAQSA
ncbi:MAG: hypothetical protein Q9215_005507 [Flavoplaca cf. flavocitrina]